MSAESLRGNLISLQHLCGSFLTKHLLKCQNDNIWRSDKSNCFFFFFFFIVLSHLCWNSSCQLCQQWWHPSLEKKKLLLESLAHWNWRQKTNPNAVTSLNAVVGRDPAATLSTVTFCLSSAEWCQQEPEWVSTVAFIHCQLQYCQQKKKVLCLWWSSGAGWIWSKLSVACRLSCCTVNSEGRVSRGNNVK